MVHPQMKVKDAELPFRILSMEDAILVEVDSATLLLVNLSVALSPIMKTMGPLLILIGTYSKSKRARIQLYQ